MNNNVIVKFSHTTLIMLGKTFMNNNVKKIKYFQSTLKIYTKIPLMQIPIIYFELIFRFYTNKTITKNINIHHEYLIKVLL